MNITCFSEFDFFDLELNYAFDLRTCGNHCLDYNRNPQSTRACVGVTFDFGKPGAGGVNQSQCWLKYEMEGSGSNRTVPVHSMKLQKQFIPNLVTCFCNFMLCTGTVL